MRQFDAIVIGFGKGGKTLAGALAGAGKKVAMIERSERMYGGSCINVACIPTKSLIHSSEMSEALGGSYEERCERYQAAIEEKDRVTSLLRKKNYDKLDRNPHVTVITGEAKFTGPHTVAVGEEELEGGQIFINTGAKPFVPPIPGLSESRHVYISETMMDLKELPRRLVVIGGGYIGLEFASMYTSFGSQVTVIQDSSSFLPREDEEIAQEVLKSLRGRGIEFLFSVKTTGVRDEGDHAVITAESADGPLSMEADAILVATGRRPNVAELNPDLAGVALTARGAVQTDEHLRTANPDIFAMGDVAGGLQFTYISLDDSRIVQSQLLGDGSRTTANRGAVPYSMFLEPPFSRVGLTEKEAREQGYDVKLARLPVAAIPKAQLLRNTDGLLKAVIDGRTGHILGAHLFCPDSHEVINLIKLAIDEGIPYTRIRDNIYTHPTMTESLNELFAAVK